MEPFWAVYSDLFFFSTGLPDCVPLYSRGLRSLCLGAWPSDNCQSPFSLLLSMYLDGNLRRRIAPPKELFLSLLLCLEQKKGRRPFFFRFTLLLSPLSGEVLSPLRACWIFLFLDLKPVRADAPYSGLFFFPSPLRRSLSPFLFRLHDRNSFGGGSTLSRSHPV